MKNRINYESDETTYPADSAYSVCSYPGIAWRVFGWEIEEKEVWDKDLEQDIFEEQRTGKLVCVMIGDDRRFTFHPEDVKEIKREQYCGVCGQIGCNHDGLERE